MVGASVISGLSGDCPNVAPTVAQKLVDDYSNVPAGTWATVDSTGTMRDGAWCLPSDGNTIGRF
jgi:hypothetical protein